MAISQRQRLAAVRRRSTRTSTPTSLAAPIKGWNTRDPFEAMDPLDAVQLDNWFPDFAGIATRNGYRRYSEIGSSVGTLATFILGATETFLAGAGGHIWDITEPSPSAPVSLGSGFGSDYWQTAQFNNRLFFANGADTVQVYDGATLAASTFTGTTLSTLKGVGVFNSRLFFWTGADSGFWYGPVLGISGALTFFDLGMVTLLGGNLIAAETLSYDGGTGIAGYTCFFMSSGEVLMYSGTDPSNPSNWAIVGRYVVAPLAGDRAIVRYGGDIYIATADDHQQLSAILAALKVGDAPPRTKISGAAKNAYLQGKGLPGWQALYHPTGRRLIFNIPSPDGSFAQHVYNTATQAWCRFVGQNGACWAIFQDGIYFGSPDGNVYQADTGSTDDGVSIVATAQQAWQLFDTPLGKRLTAVRSVIQSNGAASFNFAIGFDYAPLTISIPETALVDLSMIWGSSVWGAPTVWGGFGRTDPRWHIAGGDGAAIGFALVSNAQVSVTWVRTDLLIEPGNAL